MRNKPLFVWSLLLLALAPLLPAKAQTDVAPKNQAVVQPPVQPVQAPEAIPQPTVARAAEIAKHESDALQGKPQYNDDWMYRGPYALLSRPNADGTPGGTKTSIRNLAHLMGNNSISFYRFPWQAWEEMVPASRISDGLGINLNVADSQLPAAIKQLKAMGVTKWRMDIGWGNGDYSTGELGENFKRDAALRIALCKQAGIRALLCIDTNPALPCPAIQAIVTVVTDAKAGDTQLVIRPRPGEVPAPYKCGLSYISSYVAAEWIAKNVEDLGDGTYRLTFARPLPKAYAVGDTPSFTYLRYRPFSRTGDAEEERTYQGFLQFVQSVQDWLETQKLRKSKVDPGYDIEFLNENSNGLFFNLSSYDSNMPGGNMPEMRLYKRVVSQIRSTLANDQLVLINGFYNQLPPQPGSSEPAGSDGGSSHYYFSGQTEVAHRGPVEDAFGRDTADGYIPDVREHAPETVFHAYKVETLSRNIAPIPQQMWGRVFGNAIQPRVPDSNGYTWYANPIALEPTGKLARPTHWFKTEWGDSQYGSEEERQYKIGKFVLRGTVFALSKGLERIYWYAAADASLGLLTFDGQKLPDEEALPVTLLKRLDSVMDGGKITKPRQMRCILISEKHGHKQFEGDGTVAFPPLYNRDILFTQSFQLSDTDLMACVYVPTLNYEQDLAEETYTIRWSGVKWGPGSRAAYRDLRDRQKKGMTPSAIGPDWVEFTLPVCDWPRFVILTGV